MSASAEEEDAEVAAGGCAKDVTTLFLQGRAPLLTSADLPHRWPPTCFDLTELEWATPYDVVVLAVLWRQFAGKASTMSVVLPRDPQVRAYLVDIGLNTVIPGPWGGGGGSAVEQPLVRLTHLPTGEAWDEALNTVRPSVGAALGDATLAKGVIEIMSELIDNAATHGRSSVGTYVCAQRHTGAVSGHDPGVWVGIADAGVGIPNHLRRNHRYAAIQDDAELIRLARRPWVTGTADRRGWGLVEVFGEATASGPSDVLIRSGAGEGTFRLREGAKPHARYRHLPRPTMGTWIHVRIALGGELTLPSPSSMLSP
jgi:hypothetical protein